MHTFAHPAGIWGLPAGVLGLTVAIGSPVLAQTVAANNQAFINQRSAAGQSIVVNDTTFLQSGLGNRLGSATNNVFQSATAEGSANRLDVQQTSSNNLIGFAFDGGELPVRQQGSGNTVQLTQEGGNGNVVGGLYQRSQGSADVANELVIVQSGRENYLFDVDQQSTGLTRNTVRVILTGNRNGFAGGTVLRGETRSGALSGLTGLGELRTIGGTDAPLPFYAAFDGPAAYALPGTRPGASVLQVGSANRADVAVTGDDNTFQIDQNSRSALTAQTANLTNAVAWTVSGSSNALYALQVGAGNSATNVVVGQQNTLFVYQASEAGAGQPGYGNIVEWRQGAGVGDIQNSAELVQLGINNTVTGAQLGSLNVLHSLQRGTGNVVYAMQVGSGQLANVVQAGIGNTASVQQGGVAAVLSAAAFRR